MATLADELRARATELENRVPSLTAGPRTDDERTWLERAAILRSEADYLEARQAEGPVNDGLDSLLRRLHLPPADRDNEK